MKIKKKKKIQLKLRINIKHFKKLESLLSKRSYQCVSTENRGKISKISKDRPQTQIRKKKGTKRSLAKTAKNHTLRISTLRNRGGITRRRKVGRVEKRNEGGGKWKDGWNPRRRPPLSGSAMAWPRPSSREGSTSRHVTVR